MDYPTTGTATFHYIVIESIEQGYEVTGWYHDENTVYQTPNLTFEGVDAEIEGVLTLTANEDDPESWLIIEAFEEYIDVRTE